MKAVGKQLTQLAKSMSFEVAGGFKDIGKGIGRGVTELPKHLIADLLGRQWESESVSPTARHETAPNEGAHSPIDVEKLMRKNDQQQAAEIMHRLHSQFKQSASRPAEAGREEQQSPLVPEAKRITTLPLAQGKQNLRGSVLKGTQKRKAHAMQIQDNRTEFSKAGKLG
ncbi:MAG: hypothetical protein NUV52_03780 [Candidatus Roizmanbacteria bacterium]|nr:hypothetical protein [Candidatus Roizmanbacteria bacterium]